MANEKLYKKALLIAIILGGIFSIMYFIGEKLGIVPVLSLGTVSYANQYETIIVFIIAFVSISFIGIYIALKFFS